VTLACDSRRTTSQNYTQTGDYSYNGSASLAVTPNVTVYRVGVLVYGTEPP
jgi:hypothetical protein